MSTGDTPKSNVPGAAAFGQLVLCFTAQLLGTAMAILPKVYVFQPAGIETVVVVEDDVVELLHAAKSSGSDATTSRPPSALRAELGLRVSDLVNRDFQAMATSIGPADLL